MQSNCCYFWLFEHEYDSAAPWYKQNLFRRIVTFFLMLILICIVIPSAISISLYILANVGSFITRTNECDDYFQCNRYGIVYVLAILGSVMIVGANLGFPSYYLWKKLNITNERVNCGLLTAAIIFGIIAVLYYVPALGLVMSFVTPSFTLGCTAEYSMFMTWCRTLGALVGSTLYIIVIGFYGLCFYVIPQIRDYMNQINEAKIVRDNNLNTVLVN